MSRRRFNFIVDLLSLLVLLVLIETGLMLKFVLPPGSQGGGHSLSLAGWTRHDWGDLHFWFAVSLVALMIVHVVLHWQWVCGTVRGLFAAGQGAGDSAVSRSETAYGLIFVLAVVLLIGGLLWASYGNVVRSASEEGGRGWRGGAGSVGQPAESGRHVGGRGSSATGGAKSGGSHVTTSGQPAGEHIRGSMTLSEVEQTTGVPVATILRELGLPADTPPDRRLGQLRQEYGFDMEQVREIVQQAAEGATSTSSPS